MGFGTERNNAVLRELKPEQIKQEYSGFSLGAHCFMFG